MIAISSAFSTANTCLASILESRSVIVTGVLDMCRQLVRRYESSTREMPICTKRRSAEQCDAFHYGILLKGLIKANLWPISSDASKINKTVSQLNTDIKMLQTFDFVSYGSRYHSEEEHHNCGFKFKMLADLEQLMGKPEPSGVLDSHLKHMEEQSNK